MKRNFLVFIFLANIFAFGQAILENKPDNIFALVIGINTYKNHEGLPTLKCAVQDAESFRQHLLTIGVPSNQIYFLREKEVTSENIRKIADEVFNAKGTFYLFYAGHGLFSSRQGFYLTCYNTDIKKLSETAYAIEELKEKLAVMNANKAILFIDACKKMIGRDVEIEFEEAEEKITIGRISNEAKKKLKDLPNDKPILVITSCSIDQIAQEGEKNGIFTTSLLQGLNGNADVNKDGQLSMNEVIDYVDKAVRDQTNNEQRPDYSCSQAWKPFWKENVLPLPKIEENKESSKKVKIRNKFVKYRGNYTTTEVELLFFQKLDSTHNKIEFVFKNNSDHGIGLLRRYVVDLKLCGHDTFFYNENMELYNFEKCEYINELTEEIGSLVSMGSSIRGSVIFKGTKDSFQHIDKLVLSFAWYTPLEGMRLGDLHGFTFENISLKEK